MTYSNDNNKQGGAKCSFMILNVVTLIREICRLLIEVCLNLSVSNNNKDKKKYKKSSSSNNKQTNKQTATNLEVSAADDCKSSVASRCRSSNTPFVWRATES